MKYKHLLFLPALSISLFNAAFANEIGIVNQGHGNHTIPENSTITSNTNNSITGITAGKNDKYSIYNNGSIIVDIKTTGGIARGVEADYGGYINLGENTNLSIVNSSPGPTTGIDVYGSSNVEAKNINIYVNSEYESIGLSLSDDAFVDISGNQNLIESYDDANHAFGIYVIGDKGKKSVLNTENIIIKTNGTGINSEGESELNLRKKTVINSVAGGIESLGGNNSNSEKGSIINADSVDIKTTETRSFIGSSTGGLFSLLGGKITVGDSSKIETENMHGLYATTYIGFETPTKPTEINYMGSASNRNTVHVNGQTGATAFGNESVINIHNTDVHAHAKNGNIAGIRAVNGGAVNLENTSITVSDKDTDYSSIAAVLSSNSNSTIQISGNTYIDAEETKNKLALRSDGENSKISVEGKAKIIGNMLSKGDNSSIDINLRDQSTIIGASSIDRSYQDGKIRVSLDNSSWLMTGDSEVTSLTLAQNSVLNLSNSFDNGNNLLVQEDYKGNGGTIIFNGALAGDNSPIDHLTVNGNTSGETYVKVNELGGKGAQTVEGIEIIQIHGDSNGIFHQDGRIVAGLYDYHLVKGNETNTANWYLTSSPTPITPEEPTLPPSTSPTLRPEVGSYINNLYQASTLFDLRLHDRYAHTPYIDPFTGEEKVTSLWIRNLAGHTNSKAGSSQLKTKSDRYAVQIGGDVAQWSSAQGRYHIGVMAGYGSVSNSTRNQNNGHRSKANVDGHSIGVYGTYYANNDSQNGLYIDTWAQYNWFKNRVKGDNLGREKYDSKGLNVSVETGYTLPITNPQHSSNESTWHLQPKAQITYFGVKMENHTEENGTKVYGKGKNNIRTRLGIRFFIGESSSPYEQLQSKVYPFIEANWINNSKRYGVSMDNETIYSDGSRNIGEIKVGFDSQITKSTKVLFNVSQQFGSNGFRDTQGILGINYLF